MIRQKNNHPDANFRSSRAAAALSVLFAFPIRAEHRREQTPPPHEGHLSMKHRSVFYVPTVRPADIMGGWSGWLTSADPPPRLHRWMEIQNVEQTFKFIIQISVRC